MSMSSQPDDEFVIQPDPVIEAYKQDVDRTLLRENLKLTPAHRVEKLQRFMRDLMAIRGVARHSR